MEETSKKRLYVRDENVWLKACNKDYLNKSILNVRYVLNGIVLPPKAIQGSSSFAGGVCDENFNFIAGLTREIKNGKYAPGWCGIGEGYKVEKNSLDYIDKTVVFLGVFISAFGHMILDNMSRIWWYIKNKDSNFSFVYITTKDKPAKYFKDFFDLLGIKQERIIYIEKPTRFKEIIVPDEAVHSWADCFSEWLLPYKYLAEKALSITDCSKLPKKIYLTKSKVNFLGNIVFNEEYFERFYTEHGYEVVSPEKLPIAEQIALAANATDIATVIGTTSHFILFSKPGIKIDLLARTDYQALPPQCLINQIVKADWKIIDASLNYLYCDRATGVNFIGPSECWKKYVKENWGEWKPQYDLTEEVYWRYLLTWVKFYKDHPEKFKYVKLWKLNGFDFLQRMAFMLFGEHLDPKKYLPD